MFTSFSGESNKFEEGTVKRVDMDKQSSTQAPWIPQTPVKPIAPIYPNTAEEDSNWTQTAEGNRLVGNMASFDHLSCLDLLAMADRASFSFSSKTPWANKSSPRMDEPSRNVDCGGPEKANEAVESLSSISNIVAEQIKTPEKPKRKKHRPKVVKEAKPKTDPKPPQTPKRKYTRKKEQVNNKDQETSSHAKKNCRRTLDFQDECFKPENQEPNSDTKRTDDFSAPSTPNRKQAAKRRQGKQPTCNSNPSWIQYNEEKMRWLYFTDLQQEGMMRSVAQDDVSAVDSKCYNFTNGVVTGNFQERLSNVPLDSIETPIKKKTIGHARFRNLSSINKTLQASEQIPQKNNHHNTPVNLSKKKRKTKSETLQTNKKTLIPNLWQFHAPLSGSISPSELWKRLYSVESITDDLRLLDINRENSETALVPYPMNSQGNEMILFRGGAGAMVPLTPVKKRKPRPKVEIDNETDRVWKLLLENINSSGVDGSDDEKTKWWKEERSVLEGRAHTFIARMHSVLGNRRFTPWKGSVVDSVVGVFLTQNVSDHLSSSAFMSLAAAFPAPTVPSTSFDDAGTSSMPPPIQITYLDSEESISNPPVHKQEGSVTLQPDDEEKDSEETSRSSSEIIKNPTKTQLDSDGKVSSVEVNKRDDETYNQFPSEDTERAGSNSVGLEHQASFLKLLKGLQESKQKSQNENSREEVRLEESPKASPDDCSSEVKSLKGQTRSSDDSNEPFCCSSSMPSRKHKEETSIPDINESTSCLDFQQGTETPPAADVKGKKKEKQEGFDWDSLRREAESRHGKRERTTRTMDTVDWEAIRTADVSEVAETIKSRGMNHKLAERIQGFLDRLVREHGSIDLEWLRDVPPDQAKEYLLSFNGLGLKSVECVRLLTLHHLAFPVDVNVGRIAVRLGWVPLQPLPESLQLHLLEMYPILESIQKYLWPRLCKFDQKTLYELHYQMITFGKVFCTKSKPNCNACPMRAECRHFASAFASARLALPSTEKGTETPDQNHPPLHLPEPLQREQGFEVVNHSVPANTVTCEPIIEMPASPEPTVEVPASPEPEYMQLTIGDIEDSFYEDPEEIPEINLDMSALTSNLKKIMELQDEDMSTALVALTQEAASIPMPKLKNISQLRTEHQVYELPDSHPLLNGLEKREPDDPCSYLLAIWTPGETADSVQPAMSRCVVQEMGKLCDEETCFSCNNIKEARSQIVRGTILIPCRTATRGSFPLNGTYFQVNEVFADHDSSLTPIAVPRELIWDLRRKTVYFGTSVPTIFKGLPMETIRQCFWKGYVCVRGFDRKTRAPKPLIARLHFPVSKMNKSQDKQ